MKDAEHVVDCYKYKIPIKLSSDNMEFQNSLQVIYSSRFIFSHQNNFILAKEMIKNDRQLKKAPVIQCN